MASFDKPMTEQKKAEIKQRLDSLSDGKNTVETVWNGNNLKLTITGTPTDDKVASKEKNTTEKPDTASFTAAELAGAQPTPGEAAGKLPRYKGEPLPARSQDELDEAFAKSVGGLKISENCYDITDDHDSTTQLIGSGCKKPGPGLGI